jgi:RNA 2',3'-cyclic 3'-phosphodiesterase
MQKGSESTQASEPTRRVFFALWPDDKLRTALTHATHKAVRACGGRPVPAHNLHTTLLFLGSIGESRIPDLVALAARTASEAVAGRGSTAELVFDHIECWEKSGVLVATTSASSGGGHALADALANRLQQEAIRIGFAPDLKPFRPHVTLARKVKRVRRQLRMHEVRWPVAGFALVESVTLAEGPLYGVLGSWNLTTP